MGENDSNPLDLYNSNREPFLTFLARSNQKQVALEHIIRYLPRTGQTFQFLTEGRNVKVLDIGAGTGKITIPLVEWFSEPSSSDYPISLTIQEPSLGMAVNFFFNYLMHELPLARLSINASGAPSYGKECFDLILASHVLYYLPDWETTITSVYDALVPGGSACVILGSKESGLTKFRQKYFPIIHGTTPSTAEEFMAKLDSMHLTYTAEPLSCGIDISPVWPDEQQYKSLKEDEVMAPSIESLLSFMLRADYTRLDHRLKDEIKADLYAAAGSQQFFPMSDIAIWLRKPGESKKPFLPDKIDESIPITMGNFIDFFRPYFETYFGKDLDFLSPGLKEAYINAIALDCYLTHPISRIAMWDPVNSIEHNDDMMAPTPIPGKGIRDFRILDPNNFNLRPKTCEGFAGQNYIVVYGLSGYTQGFLVDCIGQEYEFLPKVDKEYLTPLDLQILIFNMFKFYEHNHIFCTRANGASHLSVLINSPYINILPKGKLQTQLAEIYKNMGITLQQQNPTTI